MVGDAVIGQPVVARSLPDAAMKYLHVVTMLQALAIAGCGVPLALTLLDNPWDAAVAGVIGVLVGVSLVLELWILNPMRIRWTRYKVDRSAVHLRRGRLLSRNVVIPTAQLLNVTITQGPLLARWNLAKVTFTCIAHAEHLGPISWEDAEAVRRVALSLYVDTRR